MRNDVYTKFYGPAPVDTVEIMRYAGMRPDADELYSLLSECLEEAEGKFVQRICFAEFPVKEIDGGLDLGFTETRSSDLMKNLRGCGSIVLFAGTVGMEIDRLIARYAKISPAKALMFQAIGGERIESLCDVFNADVTEKIRMEGMSTRPRFSPGYGDFPLMVQKDIFRALDCPRKIGVTLNDSLLMSPSKSVTALIGVTNNNQNNKNRAKDGCEVCGLEDCSYRRSK